MFIAALLPAVKGWEHPRVPRRGTDKQHVASACVGLSSLYRKEEEEGTQATLWGDLEDIMLSEMSQAQLDTYRMIPRI